MHPRLAFALLACLPLWLPAQDLRFDQTRTHPASYHEALPIELHMGLMFATVHIQGKPYRFLVDTGSPTALRRELADALGVRPLLSDSVQSSNERGALMAFALLDSLHIGGVRFDEVMHYIIEPGQLGMVDCFGFDGILGSNIMATGVWQFNTFKKEIRFADRRDKLPYTNAAKRDRLRLGGRQLAPLVRLRSTRRSKRQYVLFDTGYTGFVLLGKNLHDYEQAKGRFEGLESLRGEGVSSEGLFGASAASSPMWAYRTQGLRIGKVPFNTAIIEVDENDEGTKVGMDLMKRYVVTLDFRKKRFYAYDLGMGIPFDLNRAFGLGFNQVADGSVRVVYLWDGSPAARLGIANGDRVLAVEGIPLDAVSAANRCATLFKAWQLMRGQSLVNLRIQDASGAERLFQLEKDDLF